VYNSTKTDAPPFRPRVHMPQWLKQWRQHWK
jgi:hypothetical protein